MKLLRALLASLRICGAVRLGLTLLLGFAVFVLSGPDAVAQKVSSVRASVSLTSTSLTFASQPVGTPSAPQKVTLTNTGDAPLAINSITARGDYRLSKTCGATLPPGRSCVLSLTFVPEASATRQGSVTISTNATGSPHRITLSGRGADFSIAASPGAATISTGQQTVYRLTLAPSYGFDHTVSLRCSGAPAGVTCTVSPSSIKLTGSGASTVSVNVRATSGAPEGNYRLGLAATHGRISHGTNVNLIVKQASEAQPQRGGK